MQGKLLHQVSLARYTSWRVGGVADMLYQAHDLNDLSYFLSQTTLTHSPQFIGLGSNLLVRDGGVRGLVIMTHNALNTLSSEADEIYAEAGVTCAKVAKFCAKLGRGEAEFLSGIPGTIGGALAMNAGCYGSETWQWVRRVVMLAQDGTLHTREATDFKVGYRQVIMPYPNEWFAGAYFSFPTGDTHVAYGKLKALLAKRLATQPLNFPTAGSTFSNPVGDYAARLIEACGLKGYTIGGAMVSAKHANFIINLGHASAENIEELIAYIHDTVLMRYGVSLNKEIRIIGEFLHV